MLVDWLLWHRVTHHVALSAVAIGYPVATLVLGRISAIPRWRWIWAIAGLPVLAWSFGMDFTGLAPWVWIAAWWRPAWPWTAVRPVTAVAVWVVHLFTQWVLVPAGLSSARVDLTIALLAVTGIGSTVLWVTTRPLNQTVLTP